MNGLIGFVLFSAAATAYSMNTSTNALDFDKLNTIVSIAKAYNQEKCIRCGLNPLIIAICKGDEETVISLQASNPDLMKQKVQGLLPIHWAIVAQQSCIYDRLAKDPNNKGISTFNLQAQLDIWKQQQEEARNSSDHFFDTVDNWKGK